MQGILSYGAYVPYNRLQRLKIKEFFKTSVIPGEKAVSSYDEDSVTMGVEAAFNCLADMDKSSVKKVYFATTTSPYKEKSSIPTTVKALGLNDEITGMELGYSMRGSTSPLLTEDFSENTLLISADCRIAPPNGKNEQFFGDGAAALLLGNGEQVIARIVDGLTVQKDLLGQWRSQSDPYTQNWEERFISHVFMEQVTKVGKRFFEKNQLTIDVISKVIISGPDYQSYKKIAKSFGFQQNQIQNPLFDSIGQIGTAHVLMMLIDAIDNAKPGEQILVFNFSEGLDIILFEVTEQILKVKKRKGIQEKLAVKNNEFPYSKYLQWKSILETEPPPRPEIERPYSPAMYRNFHQNLGINGSICLLCHTPQFPKQRICSKCLSKDQMEDYSFVGRKGKITTFTVDHLTASPGAPVVIAVIDFEGGGRMISEVTDCQKDEIAIGMEVEMTFRRLYEVKGIHNYFWKARPVR